MTLTDTIRRETIAGTQGVSGSEATTQSVAMTEAELERACFDVAVSARCDGISLSMAEAMIKELVKKYRG